MATIRRRMSFGILIALGPAFVLSAAAQDGSPRRFALDNGLRVWHLERNESDSVAVSLSMGVGSRNETKDNNGITHFVEHMTFAGSERYDRTELMEMIEKRGGMQNAFTGEERVIYCGQISAEHFELLMDWLSQVVFHPTFPADRVDGERNVIIEEKGGEKGMLRTCVEALGQKIDLRKEMREGLFPGSNLVRPVVGEDRSLQAIGHDELLAYYRAHFMPNNAVLTVAGNVAPDRVERAAKTYFGALAPGSRPEACAAPAPMADAPATATLRAVTFTKQSTLLLGFRTCAQKDPDRWPLYVMAEYLGRVLMREGRYKKALAYDIDATNGFFLDTGYFQISTRCARSRLKPMQRLINEEIRRVQEDGVDAETLAEAKESLNGRWSLSLETNWSRIGWLEGLSRTYNETDPLPDRKALIEAVTAKDLARVATHYFVPERSCTAKHIPLI